jgi:RNA recognition motif-containing protein
VFFLRARFPGPGLSSSLEELEFRMGKNLYVGNLAYGAEDEMLRQLFEQFGPVESCEIKIDRETGRSRGFAFVMMGTDDAAQKAISTLHGQPFMNRALVVSEARPRPEGGGGFRRPQQRDRY